MYNIFGKLCLGFHCKLQYFVWFEDEKIAVENTTIPEHLEQMIEVLKIEEQENGTGSAVCGVKSLED